MVDNVIGELFTIIALTSGSHRSRDSRATQKPGCSPAFGSLWEPRAARAQLRRGSNKSSRRAQWIVMRNSLCSSEANRENLQKLLGSTCLTGNNVLCSRAHAHHRRWTTCTRQPTSSPKQREWIGERTINNFLSEDEATIERFEISSTLQMRLDLRNSAQQTHFWVLTEEYTQVLTWQEDTHLLVPYQLTWQSKEPKQLN